MPRRRGVSIRDPRVHGLGPASTAGPVVYTNYTTINRIVVSSANPPTGDSDIDFTFPVNPSKYDPQDETLSYQYQTLHGSSVFQQAHYDNRPRTMIWEGFPINYNEIESIITYFKSIESETRWFHFKDIESLNERWPANTKWKKARILKVRTKPRSGGQLLYDSVELIIQPEA